MAINNHGVIHRPQAPPRINSKVFDSRIKRKGARLKQHEGIVIFIKLRRTHTVEAARKRIQSVVKRLGFLFKNNMKTIILTKN